MKTPESFWISSKEAVSRLKREGTDLINLSKYGNLTFDIYKPRGSDKQTPHDKDEIYIVISGKGILNADSKRTNCYPGDILFVPAGMEHNFEGFSNDFCTWAVFSSPVRTEQMVM
jgi:mannose-6-phosphate isomerase-like protein (cupin superfamily)